MATKKDKTSFANMITNIISSKGRKKKIDDAVDEATSGKKSREGIDKKAADGKGRPAPSFKWSKNKR